MYFTISSPLIRHSRLNLWLLKRKCTSLHFEEELAQQELSSQLYAQAETQRADRLATELVRVNSKVLTAKLIHWPTELRQVHHLELAEANSQLSQAGHRLQQTHTLIARYQAGELVRRSL